MIAAILNSAILESAILHKKDFTNSFSLILMMEANFNCAILDSAILVFLSKSFTLAKIGSHHLPQKT